MNTEVKNSTNQIIVHSDGGARGNPGPAAIGATIQAPAQSWQISRYIGTATNNQAEYLAIKEALVLVADQSEPGLPIICYLDSELVVKQLNGQYKIKDMQLAKVAAQIKTIIENNELDVEFEHIRRAHNKAADALVNKALDDRLKRAFTFMELLVASLIFVSVMIVAAAGFAQVVKYRSVVSANLAVNQTARDLSERITNDIRNADGDVTVHYAASSGSDTDWPPPELAEQYDSGSLFLVADPNVSDRNRYLRICNDPSQILMCQTRRNWTHRLEMDQLLRQAIITAHKIDENTSRVKIYIIWAIKTIVDDNNIRPVEYVEMVVSNSHILTYNDVFHNPNSRELVSANQANVTAFISNLTSGNDSNINRIEFTIRVVSVGYNTARDYERALIKLHSTVTPRYYKIP